MSIRTCCEKHSQSPKSLKTQGRQSKAKSIRKITVQSPNLRSSSTVNMQDLNKKLAILDNMYGCEDVEEMKLLFKQWPNVEITQRLGTCNLVQLKSDVYFLGDVSNNLIHGYGLVIYNSKRFYEGYFHNNLKHGPGFERLEFGIYIGSYINNRPEGKGLFVWNNNDMYEGDFMGGIKHGHGQWITEKMSYIGVWKQNKPEGVGIIITDESKFEGDVVGGVKHGQGRETFKNGDLYVGTFVNGKFQGEGSYSWIKSGATFRGTFKNGLRHGNGIWTNPAGNKFQGTYQNNRKNGSGVFKWCSGNTYKGNFFDDLRHGSGQMTWHNGSWYKGNWKYGHQEGQGQMYEKGHSPHKGIFKNNSLVYEDLNSISTKIKLTNSYKKPSTHSRNNTQIISNSATPSGLKTHNNKFLQRLRTIPSQQRQIKPFQPRKIVSKSQNAKTLHQSQHSCSRKLCSVIKTYLNSPTANIKSQKVHSMNTRTPYRNRSIRSTQKI